MIVRIHAVVLMRLAVLACGSDAPGEAGAAPDEGEEAPMSTTPEAGFEITGREETDLIGGDVRVYRTEVTKRLTGDLGDITGTAEIERHDDGSHALTLTVEGI